MIENKYFKASFAPPYYLGFLRTTLLIRTHFLPRVTPPTSPPPLCYLGLGLERCAARIIACSFWGVPNESK